MEIKEVKKEREKRIVDYYSWPITSVLVIVGNILLGYLLDTKWCAITLKALAGVGVAAIYVMMGVGIRFLVSKIYRKFRLKRLRNAGEKVKLSLNQIRRGGKLG